MAPTLAEPPRDQEPWVIVATRVKPTVPPRLHFAHVIREGGFRPPTKVAPLKDEIAAIRPRGCSANEDLGGRGSAHKAQAMHGPEGRACGTNIRLRGCSSRGQFCATRQPPRTYQIDLDNTLL